MLYIAAEWKHRVDWAVEALSASGVKCKPLVHYVDARAISNPEAELIVLASPGAKKTLEVFTSNCKFKSAKIAAYQDVIEGKI